MKNPSSFRLSSVALDAIRTLSEHLGLSQASVIEMAVREMARKHGVEVAGTAVAVTEKKKENAKS